MKTPTAVMAILAMAAAGSALPYGKRDDVWSELRSNIKHVVYLMMENHSFDNIAGYWDFHPDIDNLRKAPHCNEYTNPNWTVWGEPMNVCSSPYAPEVPLKDPDHEFSGVSYQIYQKFNPTKNDVPNMGGFVQRQSEKYSETPGDSAFVIQAYDQKKGSTLVEIAQNYAFWDSYFAEHPGPTNTNRQFATSGSTCGLVDNTEQAADLTQKKKGTTCATSIFESLSNKGISWKNYYETNIIDAYMYRWVHENATENLVHADQFYRDLEQGTLPTFSYINPECCTIDSMHPTSNMAAGEQLIKHVYDAVRGSKYWDNVLIVLNFDEHGGFADHVPPPTNVPQPEDGISFNGVSEGHLVSYDFTRLGVRVPAFLISPYIQPNTLIHDQGTNYADNSAYTHTSILHFLQQLWGLEGLNNRVQWAKTFEHVFSSQKRDEASMPMNLSTPTWYGGSGKPEPSPFKLLNQDAGYYAN